MATTTKMKLVVGKLIANEGISLYKAMVASGYSKSAAHNPQRLTRSAGFNELLEEMLPDDELTKVHKQLLQTKKIDHMVFPTSMSDEEIEDLITSVGGTLRKVKHGDNANHAYWWVPNDKARQDALKLAYDLKGRLGKRDSEPTGDTYQTFIQQNNINPNAPSAKELVNATLDTLMQQTKRKALDP